jgi:hydrogenase maturation protein HypF
MLSRSVNAPRTTSAGRLFDAVAALVGLHQRAGFEGQAAMALEHAVDPGVADAYPLDVRAGATQPGGAPSVVDWRPLLEAVLTDLRGGREPGVIAARFHNGLVEAITAVAKAVGEPTVALTGGCFQNQLLVTRTAARLRAAGHRVLLHRETPPNDGGISLGQIAVAAAMSAGE